jgi:transcriptional/translational regulatory protein YebC/TACO1
VSRGFKRRGQIFVDTSAVEEDKLMGIVLDAGAEDMSRDGDQFEILTDPSGLDAVTEALDKAGIKPAHAEVRMVPDVYVEVKDKALAKSVMKFVEDLEDNDDVQDVFTNMNVDDAVLKELEKEG